MKFLKSNITNILLGLVISLLTYQGNNIITKLDKATTDIFFIKQALAISENEILHLKENLKEEKTIIEKLRELRAKKTFELHKEIIT
jgi:hypothetical protein